MFPLKINYHPKPKELARELRNRRTKAEIKPCHRVGCYTHTFEEIAEKDAVKQERLKELGITVLRFCDEDVVKNTDGVLRVIRRFIEG